MGLPSKFTLTKLLTDCHEEIPVALAETPTQHGRRKPRSTSSNGAHQKLPSCSHRKIRILHGVVRCRQAGRENRCAMLCRINPCDRRNRQRKPAGFCGGGGLKGAHNFGRGEPHALRKAGRATKRRDRGGTAQDTTWPRARPMEASVGVNLRIGDPKKAVSCGCTCWLPCHKNEGGPKFESVVKWKAPCDPQRKEGGARP